MKQAHSYLSADRMPLSAQELKILESKTALALIALACLGAGMWIEFRYPSQQSIAGLIFLIGLLADGLPIFSKAIQGFLSKNSTHGTEMLVSIALIASFISGAQKTAVLIPVILTAVHFFEERSILGGREALESLKKLRASTALLLRDGQLSEVDAQQLQPGDLVMVKPGMVLPADGTVVDGRSNIDQKSLTGESLPLSAKVGDQVWAGTVNLDGTLTLQVERASDQTSFAKILQLLQQAESATIPEARIVDRFLHYYIPFSLVVAALTGLFTHDLSRAITLLVVCCPCGQLLVSSAPMIAALGTAGRHGILIKGSKFIEDLTEVDIVAFDKTGTLTLGELTLTGLCPQENISPQQLLEAAARSCHQSLHPVAQAIIKAQPKNYDLKGQFTEVAGRGTKFQDQQGLWICGSTGWFQEQGFNVTRPENLGPVNWVAHNGQLLGALTFGDRPRPDAAQAVHKLKTMGINEVGLLTGDNNQAAQTIAKDCGVDWAKADLLPEHKVEQIQQLKQRGTVLLIGDGVNDVPALKEAHIGVALASLGADAAVETADLALMTNDLTLLPFAIDLARRTRKIIVQNITLTFIISFAMIALSAAGVLGPLFGATAHNLGAFAVLLNSGRLLSNGKTTTEVHQIEQSKKFHFPRLRKNRTDHNQQTEPQDKKRRWQR